MTDNRAAAEAALGDSTVLDAGQPVEHPLSDAALNAETPQEPAKEESKAPSTREALEKALADAEEKEKAKDEKPEDKAKAEKGEKDAKDGEDKPGDKVEKPKAAKDRDETGKFAKKDQPDEGEQSAAPAKADATGQDGEKARQSEGRNYSEPPARFLPEARAKWANVPNEVKADFHRVMAEIEEREQQTKQSVEAYEAVKLFDDMAKASGTTLKDALQRYVGLENLLRQNPVQGVAAVLRNIGITPEQYAKHVMANPQAHKPQPQAMPQQQAQPQESREIAALRAEIAAMRAEQTTAPIIQRFAADHPDYHALEGQIAKILQSRVIDQIYGKGLSPEQKLNEAYRMAGGQSPSRSAPTAEPEHSEPVNDRPVDPAGQKSIKGAPNAGFDPTVRRPKSNRDAAASALAELGL